MKLCLFCRKCDFENGYHCSELTYEDKSISCFSHPSVSAPFTSQEEFVVWAKHAEVCTKYEPAV